MAIIYFIFALALVLFNIKEVPQAIVTIVQAAFNPKAVTGGVVGSMLVAMQNGVARGIFSNEAGLGSAPIAAAAAQTKEPVRQGLVSMTGTFIDTIVICTLTGLSVVITGAWQVEGLEGVQVTTYAFQHGLPFSNTFCAAVLMICHVWSNKYCEDIKPTINLNLLLILSGQILQTTLAIVIPTKNRSKCKEYKTDH